MKMRRHIGAVLFAVAVLLSCRIVFAKSPDCFQDCLFCRTKESSGHLERGRDLFSFVARQYSKCDSSNTKVHLNMLKSLKGKRCTFVKEIL